jgi:shikimate kinase
LALQQALADLRGGVSRVIALGGGAFAQKTNAALLAASGFPTIFLDASVEELWQRCSRQADQSGAERPLLKNMRQFRQLYQSRRKSYQKASLKIATGGRTVDAVAADIANALALKSIAFRTEQGEVE